VKLNPVALPPGRAKLSTKPPPTESPTFTNTIGTVLVASSILFRNSGRLAGRVYGVASSPVGPFPPIDLALRMVLVLAKPTTAKNLIRVRQRMHCPPGEPHGQAVGGEVCSPQPAELPRAGGTTGISVIYDKLVASLEWRDR
jgi:hypothetical protein